MGAAYNAGDINMPAADDILSCWNYFYFETECAGAAGFGYQLLAWFTRIASGHQPPTLD